MSTVYSANNYAETAPSGRGMRKPRPTNCGSDILDADENEALFACLPCNNYSLYAAVAEVLQGQPDTQRWIRLHRGVLSLVKDYDKRAYFLRVFDIQNRKVLWSEKMYKNFTVTAYPHCVNLLTFEAAEGRIFGLNFANSTEATKFKGHVDKRNEAERKAHPQRPMGGQGPMVGSSTVPAPMGVAYGTRPAAFNSNGVSIPSAAVITAPQPEKDQRNFFGMKKKTKKENRKIRKEDISNPTNFEHRAHVGWNQDTGIKETYSNSNHIDETIAEIIAAAGVSAEGMDKKTKKFVYDFIDKYQKTNSTMQSPPPIANIQGLNPPIASVPQKIQHAPLNHWPTASPHQAMVNPSTPPPPPRISSTQPPPARPPPPPPSQGPRVIQTQQRALPQVPTGNGFRPEGGPPPPPPPPMPTSGAPPPPPPPPPPGFMANGPPPAPRLPNANGDPLRGLPTAQPNRGDLLAQIQAGKALRSVGTTNAEANARKTSSNDVRGDVMEQIKAGAQLKHVDMGAEQEKRKSTQGGQDLGGIAGALARALAERRNRIDSDSDSDESEENNEWSDS